MFSLEQVMQQAQKMQESMIEVKESLAKTTIEATAGSGVVRVVVNGSRRVEQIVIDRDEGVSSEQLQTWLCEALNEALQRIDERIAGEMKQVTGGLALPGLF